MITDATRDCFKALTEMVRREAKGQDTADLRTARAGFAEILGRQS